MIDEHIEAFAALIDAVDYVTVYADEGVPANPEYPYVAVYGNQGQPENASMADESSWVQFTVQTTCVALTQGQARALADRQQTALLDKRPTVSGRQCGLISKTSSQRVRPDFDVKPTVFYAVDVWTFLSVPA